MLVVLLALFVVMGFAGMVLELPFRILWRAPVKGQEPDRDG